jgi:hypothetical protein
MPRLLSLPAITTAIAVTTTPTFQVVGVPHDMTAQAVFNYGAGTGTVDAWIQTTVDNSLWCDVCNFHFVGSSIGPVVFNLSSQTPITSAITPSDGSLAANTAVDGIVGSHWRIKYQSTGTYSGGTSLAVDLLSSSRLEPL